MDTMVGLRPSPGTRLAGRPAAAPEGRGVLGGVPAPGLLHVQEPARRALRRRPAGRGAGCDGPVRRREGVHRRERRRRHRAPRRSRDHPDRFVPTTSIDPSSGMDTVRALRRAVEDFGVKAAGALPVGTFPQRPDRRCSVVTRCTRPASTSACRSAVHGDPRTTCPVRATARDGRSTGSATSSPSS